MIQLHKYPSRQPVILDGPHKRTISRLELISDITGIIAIGTLLAISFFGMTGALS
jgi:hypothetical protein